MEQPSPIYLHSRVQTLSAPLSGKAGRSLRWLAASAVMLSLSGCGDGGDDDTGAGSPTPDPAVTNSSSWAGDFNQWILLEDPYPQLEIEVDVMDGALDSEDAQNTFDEALDTLVATIEMVAHKPGGVNVLEIDTIPSDGGDAEFTLEEVDALELEYRDNYWHDDTMTLYFLYLDGHSDYDDPEAGTSVVGYAYHGSSMAIFMDTVMAARPLSRANLLKTVTVHEFGHQIGLVDNGVKMQVPHDDDEHSPHCDNSGCMMYWLNNGGSIADLLSGDIPDFDDNCLQDIFFAGGKDARSQEQPN